MRIIIPLLWLLLMDGFTDTNRVKTIERAITSPKDIAPIADSLVVPYVYVKAVSLKNLPVPQKKRKFFAMMLPAILVAKTEQQFVMEEVKNLAKKTTLTTKEQVFVDQLMKEYKAKTIHMLIARLHGFPVSIVLAQAAVESGWGTSRFFLQANNPFGMWSFNSDQQRIAASSHRSGEKVYLRKFNNLEQAIEAYYVMLATGPYADFRLAIHQTDDPYQLCDHLLDYSERGEAYVQEIKNVIRMNDLTKYDSYRIAPKYIVE
jgi:Bax protein